MELGVLNKIDRELNNSSKKKSDQNYDDESFQGKQGPSFSQNFFYKPPKEYKASTLDWLGGQARI